MMRKGMKTLGLIVGLAALSGFPAKGDLMTSANAALTVPFNPTQSGTVSAPMEGISETTADYFLAGIGSTDTLPLDYTGNGEDIASFANPGTVQDAASFSEDQVLHLGRDNNITRVNIGTGTVDISAGVPYAGPNAFGIGFDPNDGPQGSIGVGSYDGTTMALQKFDIDSSTFTPLANFAFDNLLYGTPTGVEFRDGRMLVATRDIPGVNIFAPNQNGFYDIDATTGVIDQEFNTLGSANKLEDVSYENGVLTLANSSGSSGFVQRGDYQLFGSGTVPEPSTGALAGLGAVLLAYSRRFHKK
jgi:hypothetical protein